MSLQELKRHLSRLVDRARAGERIVITRYRQPVAELGSPSTTGLRTGAAYGTGLDGPPLDKATGGRYLDVLEEDRREAAG